ncbi:MULTISPECIES: hypothetical protein [Burkholderia]|nr:MULTISPECIES: hypothetical protein [Burkholderia]EKS9800800.1 hypothetical protein [Burkholderia cepacia]EKS9808450.1 hypothetical protein [Burkholderia cepacia]EKS9816079.1 hypothetical protein [Burkholderia cepacia]EKS9823778.1 hypothetical protein [Burkholderia cepacia]EKS9829489.1 hypothetical protein [Burkholderia cepacia]
MDIITQIYCTLNARGYGAASPPSEEIPAKHDRCGTMPVVKRQIPTE